MKSILYYILIICLTGCLEKKKSLLTGLENKPMPSFNLILIDSITHINIKNIRTSEPIVLFYFSPWCPHCRVLTKNIVKDIDKLSNIKFYLLSIIPLTDIKQYNNHYQLHKFSNITVAQDYEMRFTNYFKAAGVPFLAIYNKNKILKSVLNGEVSTKQIKEIAFK